VRRDGAAEDRWFTFNVRPMRDATGKVCGMLAVAMDITETVGARRTLERLYGEREKLLTALESASRMKDEFLATLGHELRNPLAPIQAALHVMKLKQPTALLREREIIERQASHLGHLVDDLLDVARIAQGKVELHLRRVSLASVITHAVEMSSPLFEDKRHVLTVDVSAADLDVHADPMRLEQVFTNLLTNAAKYTERGAHIDVRAWREDDRCVVRVSDNGIGIAPDQIPYSFDAFFEVPRERSVPHGGLGLGLALVKSLVSLHGGTVTAHSPGLGQGSVFEVRLPALPAALKAEPMAEPKPRHRAPPAGRRRVLLVDDSEDILEIVSSLLTFEGYEVLAAHDGPSALEAATSFHPDVAILDIGLPEMDGYELAHHLREDLGDQTPKLIAMTGYGHTEDSERVRAAGFEAHLVKPVDPEALLESIRG
jgi:signal transduction histidine kinase